jgi:serine/threonine protein kinase
MSGDQPTVAEGPRTAAAAVQLPARFTVKGTLGEGGMGTVLEAYDRTLGRDVAIKLLKRSSDRVSNERFLREARAAAKLHHQGIVQVYDIDPEGGYIVMELVRGEALSARLARERKLSIAEVRRVGGALLEALGAAHAAGVVHRDVKPANILLGEHGEVKLADFGVALFDDSDLTMPGTRVGTPMYMPPEQLRARDVDARSDVYAAGATLFEAATGMRLHDEATPADRRAVVLEATSDRALASAIARAVREAPAERFANGRAFAHALDAVEPARRARWPWLAAIAIAMGAGGAGYVWHARSADALHRTVALLPFVDATHDDKLDFAAAGLPNLVGLELHGQGELKVLGYYQLLANVSGPGAPLAEWRAAAVRLGADVIVRGELHAAGSDVRVEIFVDAAGTDRLDDIQLAGRIDEVPGLVRGAVPRIVHSVVGRDIARAASRPTSFQADRHLQLGIADLEREKLSEASEHFRDAIQEAPELPLAHYYYALCLYWVAPPAEPVRAEIDKAIALGLDPERRALLEALRELAVQSFARGIAMLQPLAERYPDDHEIQYVLFEALFHGGRPADAVAVYRRLVARAPHFRLALIHLFTYYMAHADRAGMQWALSQDDPDGDPYSLLWKPRVSVADRNYDAAIQLLSREIETKDSTQDLKMDLAEVYQLSDQLDLAKTLLEAIPPGSSSLVQVSLMGVAMARGDEAERERQVEAALRAVEVLPNGGPHSINLEFLIAADVFAADRAELDELSHRLESSIVPDYGRSLNLNLAQVLLAEARGDLKAVTRLAASEFPEVSELAKAALARASGDRAAAASAMRRSIEATGDARYLIDQWMLLAGDLRASGDRAGVIAACDEVIRPRMIAAPWGATIGRCLAWTAEAQTALGHGDAARAAWQRLLRLRTAANDDLVQQARAGLR